ncbi:SusD/RagB family nutrient-binding outer membrane lipoprotein [Parabacteroides distasonis]|uniref:SusD/RagB family nutrient-binding outer membrane lipoprotein n=1 Tax=Parabacteroides distasonis TaxID=823 RepID=UPI00189E6DA4|nr:SusD/RagB family nutrient-binding outer membrane lipoprotein [Parabacteroides distasonis]MDB9154396.1 SusD/RagB family nutrient-binding outer membrane lipoprotein [Parabacteroides distasonis]MDB9158934.1 SusD/RagB family nutrient-binding outer membrane lipoprotein [Parabacteroides distasonis]MDB9167713.1 SusD/RagB family nutrient-binding outer membrane lipoprotein [Parabacteroides distasonis]MDB9172245.1 SusD/RagB family nutrient-binding outer membrane lipoprotein [Parabacteroides distasonis
MKKIISMLLAGAALMSVTSCSDSDYDEKYVDPSKTTTVAVPNVFTGILEKGNTWMNPVYYRIYVQMSTSGIFSGVLGDSNSRGRFMGAGEGRYDDRWKAFYDMVTQYRLLEYTYNNLPEDEKASNAVFYYLGRTLVESQLHEMLSLFGDVPYTGTGTLWINGNYDEAKSKCVYDDDVTLYKQILNDLKETNDYLANNVTSVELTSLAHQDYTVAKGDATAWRKYVNSLRLRIALHLATNGDCVSEAHAAIAEILNNPSQYPVIDNNDENMGVTADTQSDTFNFGKGTSQALHGNDGASQTMLRVMNLPANGIPDTNTDPRIQAMYDCNPDDAYIAYDVMLTNAEITNLSDKKKQEYVQRGMSTANYYCKLDSLAYAGWAEYQGNENLFGLWISAAEVSLSKAEAYLMGYGVATNANLAKTNFIEGVKQSCAYYWNQKESTSLYKTDNDSYYGYRALVRPTDTEITAYAENIWEPTQEAICTQQWINFSYVNMLEAWNVVRRTGYPEVTFATDNEVTSYPTPPNRLPYPNDELTYNAQNCQDAIAKNYEEPLGCYTNLFWAKKTYYKIVR